MKVLHLNGPVPLYTNTFLVLDEQGAAAAVDPAAPAGRYLELLEKNGAKLTHILLTHGHYDHVGAVRELREKTGARVYLAREDAVGDRLLPLMGSDVDEDYADGGEIAVGSLRFTAYRTPGHSAGSVCLLCGDVLFSGDTLFAGDIGRTDLENSDPQAMRRSLEKLCRAVHGEVQVLPGHEEFSTMEDERAHNPYLAPFAQL